MGIVGGLVASTGFGLAALLRSSKGDRALAAAGVANTVASDAKSLWDQTTRLINELQEEVDRQRQTLRECETTCKGVSKELAELKIHHAQITRDLEALQRRQ